jgi:hypothetical protein
LISLEASKKVLYFLEHQLRPKEFSPKPKENNVIIKQRKTEKINCCLIKVVD